VTKVDLELAGRELMVSRRHPQAGIPELPQHVHEQAAGIALAADKPVDAGEVAARPTARSG
jgi:hypothetical protein